MTYDWQVALAATSIPNTHSMEWKMMHVSVIFIDKSNLCKQNGTNLVRTEAQIETWTNEHFPFTHHLCCWPSPASRFRFPLTKHSLVSFIVCSNLRQFALIKLFSILSFFIFSSPSPCIHHQLCRFLNIIITIKSNGTQLTTIMIPSWRSCCLIWTLHRPGTCGKI